MTFLWLILLVLFCAAIIIIGLMSLAVFIEAIFNPDEIDNEIWKE